MSKVLLFGRKASGALAVGELDRVDALPTVDFGQAYLREKLDATGVVLALIVDNSQQPKLTQ